MNVYSLTELNLHIRETLEDAYPDAIWIRAEIASFNLNTFSGHCYLELTDGEGQSAKARAMIWKKTFEVLNSKFRIQTGVPLGKELQVQLLVKVEFNIQYGLSLVVWDIDASYTLGNLAIRKTEVLERLRKEDLLDRNKKTILPIPAQRLAVVSSPTAAGWEDFKNHLLRNEYGFAWSVRLFAAQMQGKEAGESIARAVKQIADSQQDFDAVILIRGGGSSLDLQLFDEYETAAALANCPLPVLTGIGHERNESVCDRVAWRSFKTPTAVAHFFIDHFLEAEGAVAEISQSIAQNMSWSLRRQEEVYETLHLHTVQGLQNRLSLRNQEFTSLFHSVHFRISASLQEHRSRLDLLEHQIQVSNPLAILRKGYARVFQDGKRKKSKAEIAVPLPFVVQLQDGSVLVRMDSDT